MIMNYSFYQEGEHSYMKIFVTTDEYADCNYALNNLPAEKIREDNFNSGFNTLFFIKFQDLEEGDYMFTATCYDVAGNYKSNSIRFDMADLTPPFITLIPDPPEVVYKRAYNITGVTEPLVNIDVQLYDEKGSLLETYSGYQGADVSEPESDFNQITLGTNPDTLTFPQTGENEIFFEGDYHHNVGINDYLGFSDDPVTRYDITGVFDYMEGVKTRVIITPPIDRNIDGSQVTASAYLSPLATGYFEVPIELRTGINNIKVTATRESGSSNYLSDRITYLDTYAPAIYLDYPPVWQGAISTIKNPTFTGSITSTTTLPIQSSTLTINEVTYDLALDQDDKFSQTVNLPVDGNYSFEILASNSMDEKTEPGYIIIDSEGPGGCIRVGENIYCTIGGCRDSDGGKEYTKKGWTCAGNPVECLSDYCDNNKLKEYYCDGINKAEELHDCPGTCEDGACSIITIPYSCQELISVMNASSGSTCNDQKYDKRADIDNDKDVDLSDLSDLNLHIDNATWCSQQLTDKFNPCTDTCTDSDGGKDYYVKGESCGSGTCKIDNCYNDNLVEYYCENDQLREEIPSTPEGYVCYGGIFVEETTCTDSDGGKNYYVRGKVSGYEDGVYGEITDKCVKYAPEDYLVLNEGYCIDNKAHIIQYNCPNSCEDGACITLLIEEDIDGLEYLETKVIHDCELLEEIFDESQCTGTYMATYALVNGGADEVNALVEDHITDFSQQQVIDYMISNFESGFEISVGEFEGNSYYYFNDKDISDSIRNSAIFWISDKKIIYLAIGNWNVDLISDDSIFEPLAISYFEKHPSTLCTDSDGGKDYYVKGTITYGDSTADDSCEGDVLTEFFCDPDFDEPLDDQYNCPNGCSDGACI
jgi:hypothetical protein